MPDVPGVVLLRLCRDTHQGQRRALPTDPTLNGYMAVVQRSSELDQITGPKLLYNLLSIQYFHG